MVKEQEHMNRMWWIASAAVLLFVAAAVVPVAATNYVKPYPANNNTYVPVANPDGARFQTSGAGAAYYYFNLTNTTGGMNAIHITDYTTDVDCQPGYYYNGTCFSGIYTVLDPSRTFYVSDTGGKGCQDDILLLVAVYNSSENYSNFGITLNASGYTWTPTATGNLPSWKDFKGTPLSYWNGSFTSSDFLENSTIPGDLYQEWKFAPTADYPIYNGQTMGANESLFKVMLIDLKLGVIGNKTKSGPTYFLNLTDKGMVNVTYTLTGLGSGDLAAFNVYAYNDQTSQGQGVNWLNRVYKDGDDSIISNNASGWRDRFV